MQHREHLRLLAVRTQHRRYVRCDANRLKPCAGDTETRCAVHRLVVRCDETCVAEAGEHFD